ncbi:PP2C family protein-serine/threonine phosphatase [Nonomuraea aridisoli]|uniref:protein-serine/threonine phosphatase n=1 Tax=Nonomuraea aridisoli TaxID=2070368 RepID=A0A2W2E7K7_9ACTN|nr:GAF domain-containing SpoIIE family protein phosphatase [Nonomuraea aridisoli]PZG18533.1 DNA-binding protein [Nonomuraea aridisoli]
MDTDRSEAHADEALQHARVLSHAITAMHSTPSVTEGMRRLSSILTCALADWCAIDALGDDGRPYHLAVTHRDPGRVPDSVFTEPLPRLSDETPGPVARAMRGSDALLLTGPLTELPPARESGLELFGQLDGKTAMVVPLRVRWRTHGALTLAREDPAQAFTPAEQRLIKEIAHGVSLALDHARLYDKVRHIAERMQRSLLPDLPQVDPLRLAARYIPAYEAAEVGGDWYDAFLLPKGELAVVIGDVAGHDLSAAVIMSQLRNMMRALAYDRQEPPGEILSRLDLVNDALYGQRVATCLYGLIRTPVGGPWAFDHSSAGHMPPLLVTREGEARYLEDGSGLLLGMDVTNPRPEARDPLPPHSTLLLYTDGLVERPGEDIGRAMDRLRRQAATLAKAPVERFCDELLAARGEPDDDIALLALRVPDTGPGVTGTAR